MGLSSKFEIFQKKKRDLCYSFIPLDKTLIQLNMVSNPLNLMKRKLTSKNNFPRKLSMGDIGEKR